MIYAFNPHERCRPEDARPKPFYIDMSQKFRAELKRFPRASLAVFLAVALDLDEAYEAHTSYSRIEKHTGLTAETIYRYLAALCGEPLTKFGDMAILVGGKPPLIRERRHGNDGKFITNRYKVLYRKSQDGLLSAVAGKVDPAYIRIDAPGMRGKLKLFEGNASSLACFLAMHLKNPNSEREVEYSIKRLAKDTGYHPNSARTGLQRLADIEIDGLPLIARSSPLGENNPTYRLWPSEREIAEAERKAGKTSAPCSVW